MQPRILEVRTKILKKNDEIARALRGRFSDLGVYVINVVSSPGAGKTELLTQVMRTLRERGLSVAAVVGDLATENDADRMGESGCPTKQILTGTMCHLEADMVEAAVEDFDLANTDVLFVENVGNLVCPQGFDLGEDLRVLFFPSTEGEDKPLKYPTLINTCDLVVLSKMDLADAVEFDTALARRNCDEARPGVPIIETSAKSRSGVDELADAISHRVTTKQSVASGRAVGA
ncbi:MAG: hydrogenase nickel incorporation protein HypB [Phycisphaerales bacterium]|nr:hydrogenase nickel incorporation protein HypB [Phycisphaerales bacterium]